MQPCSSYGDTNYVAVFLSCTLVSYYSVLHHPELIMAKEYIGKRYCTVLQGEVFCNDFMRARREMNIQIIRAANATCSTVLIDGYLNVVTLILDIEELLIL